MTVLLSLVGSPPRGVRTLVISVIAVFVLLGCSSAPDGLSAVREAQPTPEMSPREVVETQLIALGNNTDDDEGIEIAFRFASPENRRQTGPLPRFAAMLRQPPYQVMLQHDRAEYAPTSEQGNRAVQSVALYYGDVAVVFTFVLRRQTVAPYQDCWMTEAVFARAVATGEDKQVL